MLKFLLLAMSIFSFYACSNPNDKFDAMGIFESDEIIISSEIQGKILEFNIQEGQKLQKDQIIGKIDSVSLELKKKELYHIIKALKLQKLDIKNQLSPLFQQLKDTLVDKKRYYTLLKNEAISQKEYDDINAKYSLLEKEINAKKENLTLKNASIDEQIQTALIQIAILEDSIAKSFIRSPIYGTVLEKYAFAGELSKNQALFKIADLSNLYLKAYIINQDYNKIKLKDNVKIISDTGKSYQGVVSYISQKAEFTPKTIMSKDERENLVYMIKINVKNDGYLKIGTYAEVHFYHD
ncbi:HlyD family efflux transporter periplasmic adaptor subunit [Campylobacter lari]|nr:HlyD family efflux transporter periplasmic adaptor subunit [Campylobacter lari]